jgi:2-dehydropantoate 2-reductase
MKIGIIGGGAIGLLYAAYLSDTYAITVYTRTKTQAESINALGVNVIRDNEKVIKLVRAKQMNEGIDREDLLIVAVKQYHLDEIIPYLTNTSATLLFLQNGYSHIRKLQKLLPEKRLIGVVEHGSLKVDERTVQHTGIGLTRIAAFTGNLQEIALLQSEIEHFPFVAEENYETMLLEKLAVNAVINSLTSILNVENGKLLDNPYYYELFKTYSKEVVSILELPNVQEALAHIEKVCRATEHNRSSMLKDLESGRKTEVDAITGCVLERAKEKKKSHKMTTFLYSMIKGKENEKEDSRCRL